MRSSEKTSGGKPRDVELGQRWMDAMSIDYFVPVPTMLLAVGMHPSTEMEIELCWATTAGSPETALPAAMGGSTPCFAAALEPDEALRQVETFGGRKSVTGLHGVLGAQPAGGTTTHA